MPVRTEPALAPEVGDGSEGARNAYRLPVQAPGASPAPDEDGITYWSTPDAQQASAKALAAAAANAPAGGATLRSSQLPL